MEPAKDLDCLFPYIIFFANIDKQTLVPLHIVLNKPKAQVLLLGEACHLYAKNLCVFGPLT